ncbi:hypothetical protein HK405_003723 [Cladochytrium tenue]|nr:hypothetical protein HK405_003723 [Cladochytrium tenue]
MNTVVTGSSVPNDASQSHLPPPFSQLDTEQVTVAFPAATDTSAIAADGKGTLLPTPRPLRSSLRPSLRSSVVSLSSLADPCGDAPATPRAKKRVTITTVPLDAGSRAVAAAVATDTLGALVDPRLEASLRVARSLAAPKSADSTVVVASARPPTPAATPQDPVTATSKPVNNRAARRRRSAQPQSPQPQRAPPSNSPADSPPPLFDLDDSGSGSASDSDLSSTAGWGRGPSRAPPQAQVTSSSTPRGHVAPAIDHDEHAPLYLLLHPRRPAAPAAAAATLPRRAASSPALIAPPATNATTDPRRRRSQLPPASSPSPLPPPSDASPTPPPLPPPRRRRDKPTVPASAPVSPAASPRLRPPKLAQQQPPLQQQQLLASLLRPVARPLSLHATQPQVRSLPPAAAAAIDPRRAYSHASPLPPSPPPAVVDDPALDSLSLQQLHARGLTANSGVDARSRLWYQAFSFFSLVPDASERMY